MDTIKSYTDLEQSRKLAEILPIESADMRYGYIAPYEFSDRKYDGGFDIIPYHKDFFDRCSNFSPNEYDGELPCWSLAALLNILPSEFTEKNEYSETTYKIDIRKYALTDDVDLYQIAYGNYKFYEDGHHSWKDIVNTGEKENLLDAAFQMICLLKKNGKI